MDVKNYFVTAYIHKISAKDRKIVGKKFTLSKLSAKSNKKSISSCKKFAYFFEKEMKRERRPSSNIYDEKSRCYLINIKKRDSNDYLSVGTIVLKQYFNAEGNTYWGVVWVWIHPFERKEGALKFAIKELEKLYGELFIKDIISLPMAAFAKKYNKKHNLHLI